MVLVDRLSALLRSKLSPMGCSLEISNTLQLESAVHGQHVGSALDLRSLVLTSHSLDIRA